MTNIKSFLVHIAELHNFIKLLCHIKDIHYTGYFMMNTTITPRMYIIDYTFMPIYKNFYNNPAIKIFESLNIKYTKHRNSIGPTFIQLHIHKKEIPNYINLLKLYGLYSEYKNFY
jgi:hypothetical protein